MATDVITTKDIENKTAEILLTLDSDPKLQELLAIYQNVRSHIRGVVIIRDVHSDAHMAIHQVCVQEYGGFFDEETREKPRADSSVLCGK